jgi:hypothetical protein
LRRLVGSKSFPSLLPVTRSARRRLPSGGSLGLHFPTLSGRMLSYDCLLPVSGRFPCRSLPDPLFASSVCVPSAGSWPLRSSYAYAWPTWSPGTPLPGSSTRRQGALPRSPVPPLSACPALRPRWRPRCSPLRAADRCLPLHCRRRLWLPSLQLGVIRGSTTIHISGLNPAACPLAPPGFGLPLPGLPAGFATVELARLWTGGIFTHRVTIVNFIA